MGKSAAKLPQRYNHYRSRSNSHNNRPFYSSNPSYLTWILRRCTMSCIVDNISPLRTSLMTSPKILRNAQAPVHEDLDFAGVGILEFDPNLRMERTYGYT